MSARKPFKLLKTSILTLANHPVILFPFYIVAFLQFLLLEIIFFYPRQPLITFFAPVVKTFFGEVYLHYPMNLVALPQIYQYVQYIVFIFFSSLFLGIAISIIHDINEGKSPKFSRSLGKALRSYVFIVIASAIAFAAMWGLTYLYGMAFNRALLIRSESGPFYLLKRFVTAGSPYIKFMISVLVTAVFAHIIPVIIIERKKIFGAIWLNFICFFKNFFTTMFLVLIPSLFYIPILLLRQSIPFSNDFPEMGLLLLCASILITILIDAVIYCGITINYLLNKEEA